MKLLPLVCVLFLLYGCENQNRREEKYKDSVKEEVSKKLESESLANLSSAIGKYPKQEGLFSEEPLQSRLKLLLEKKWENFDKEWNTETPIQKEGNILHTSGCKVHDCALNMYDLFIDLEHNNINVYHIKNGRQKIYKENDQKIDLPQGFAHEIDIKRENASLQVLPPRL